MNCKTALTPFFFLGALCACDAPQQSKPPVQPAVQKEPEVVRSKEQIVEMSENCGRKAREGFERDQAEDATKTAEFRHRYHEKLDACFYLVTVGREGNQVSSKLVDINEGELYGEYLGPAAAESFPDTCRMAGLYCASRREWEVLAGFFMQDQP